MIISWQVEASRVVDKDRSCGASAASRPGYRRGYGSVLRIWSSVSYTKVGVLYLKFGVLRCHDVGEVRELSAPHVGQYLPVHLHFAEVGHERYSSL
nr:hypothetical protein CFP56_20540 [Quercus suber]